MKKIISLLLALAMCLSLCACGGATPETTVPPTEAPTEAPTEPAPAMHQIGETVSTDIVEVVLNDTSFSEFFNVCTAQEGYSFVVVNFSIKNIGKTDLSFFPTFYGHESKLPASIVAVDYKDGYIFYVDDVVGKDGNTYDCSCFEGANKKLLSDMKPLSGAETFEIAICVPNQVIEDADAPLLVKLNLLNSAGETEVAIYSIR